MATSTRHRIYLLIVSCITLSLLVGSGTSLPNSPTDSSHTWTLSQTLNQELSYEFNDSSSESVQTLFLSDLTLTNLNSLNLTFVVEGDKSTSDGISITFYIEDSIVDFLIERIYQDNQNHSIIKSFISTEDFLGDSNITVIMNAQAPSGKSGLVRIFSSTEIQNLAVITLEDYSTEIPLLPINFKFEGEMLGISEYKLMTLINCNDNITYSLGLSVNFTLNDFNSFVEELSVSVNDKYQETQIIKPNQDNILNFILQLDEGLNQIEFIFHVEISTDIIEINDLKISGKLIPKSSSTNDIFDELHWENIIDSEIKISDFKPPSLKEDNILNINLVVSFEGTKIYSGINYEITQNSISLESGTISASKQSITQQIIKICTYTEHYSQELYIHLSASYSGSGVIYIYNSSSISVSEIIHLDQDTYDKQFVGEIEVITPTIGVVSESLYDVIYLKNSFVHYQCNLSMIITSDSPFETITITVKSGSNIAFTKTVKEDGVVNLVGDINLFDGYNELEFVITILGEGATVTFKQIEYKIYVSSDTGGSETNNPSDPIEIPFFKSPENIIVGIFVLFNCWILMGIFLRIYRGRKLRKKYQTENDEYVLEIAQITQDS